MIAKLRALLAKANATECESKHCAYFGKRKPTTCRCERDREKDMENLRYRAVNALPRLLDALEAAKGMRKCVDCPMCDYGDLRDPAKPHWDECSYGRFDAALARLEKGK